MKKINKFLMIIGVSLFMTSCYYDSYIELPDDDNGGVLPTGVSFKDEIQPIFTAKCVNCHNGNIANPDLRDGTAYNAIVPAYVIAGDATNSDLYKNLPGIDHPIDAGFELSTKEKELIEVWIDEGAKNN